MEVIYIFLMKTHIFRDDLLYFLVKMMHFLNETIKIKPSNSQNLMLKPNVICPKTEICDKVFGYFVAE